ncbi:MAG: hypothetical protein ACUVSX_09680 [Aggregatilineales bacterium]
MRLLGNAAVLVAGVMALAFVTIVMLAPETLERLFAGIGTVNIALRTVAMVVVNLFVLALVYLRLRRRPAPNTGLIVQVQGALANVEVESARAIVLRAMRNVPDVRSAEATIRAVQGRADIEVDVTIGSAAVNIPDKQKEINRVLRQVINKQLGLRLEGRPRVNIRLEAPALASGPVEKPASSAASAVPVEAAAKSPEAAETEQPSEPAHALDTEAAAEASLAAGAKQEPGVSEPDLSPAESSQTGFNDDWLRNHLRDEMDEKDRDAIDERDKDD